MLRKLWLFEADHTVKEIYAGQRRRVNNNRFLYFVPTTTNRREKRKTLLLNGSELYRHSSLAFSVCRRRRRCRLRAVFRRVIARVWTKSGFFYGSASAAANVGVVRPPRLAPRSAHCFDFY